MNAEAGGTGGEAAREAGKGENAEVHAPGDNFLIMKIIIIVVIIIIFFKIVLNVISIFISCK